MSSQKIFIGLIAVFLLALVVFNVSSCGCTNSENYIPEYSGRSPNYKTSPNSYRLFVNGNDNGPRDRCQFCKDYTNINMETFVDTSNSSNNFKLCPHNCREYGVASCNQANIM